MKTCLYKPVFVNPQAYFVFPQLYDMQPKTDNFVEQAIFTGRLIITDLTNNQYTSYQNVNTIDFSQYADKRIKIEQYTDTGAVVLGEWIISQDTTGVKPIASYRAYDKTNDDEDRAVMKDLTGNGHDIQLYNFAFAESSGYGKYATDFTKWNKRETSNLNLSKDKIEVTGSLYDEWIIYNITFGVNEYTINVKGLKEGLEIYYVYSIDGSYKTLRINSDGLYTIPQSEANKNGIGFKVSNREEDYTGLTIEQIPDYQGALVSDGVDDYGLCENFPILTKEKGYTVCAIRAIINTTNLGSMLGNGTNYTNGSFLFEYYLKNETDDIIRTVSFGGISKLNPQPSRNISFIYQTKDKYNGKVINVGNTPQSGDILALFLPFKNGRFSSIALYALEIYDRDLTDEEIATVKARMIAEYEEKTGNKYEEETV